jgi:hypothetical protein
MQIDVLVPKKSAQMASKSFHILAAGHEPNTMQDLILTYKKGPPAPLAAQV